MKYGVIVFILLLVACIAPQTQEAINTATPIPSSPTPQIIEITRVVRVEQTIVVTSTPLPLLAQTCFDKAITQLDLGGCAAEERFLAQAKLEEVISRIDLSAEEKQTFHSLQKEWEQLVERTCNFYYEKWGSMRAMQQSMCIALHIKERTKELELIYLTPDG